MGQGPETAKKTEPLAGRRGERKPRGRPRRALPPGGTDGCPSKVIAAWPVFLACFSPAVDGRVGQCRIPDLFCHLAADADLWTFPEIQWRLPPEQTDQGFMEPAVCDGDFAYPWQGSCRLQGSTLSWRPDGPESSRNGTVIERPFAD